MPMYEYRCINGHDFDAYSSVDERNVPRLCDCGVSAFKIILHAPRVFGDLEGYESPASGRWVEGRRARERDFKETGTRAYEAGEREAMARRQKANDAALERSIDHAVEQTINEITL